MLGDFILELVVAPGISPTISLPNVAPAGRIPWSLRFTYRQPVFYIIDDTTKQEWGYGTFIPGTPPQITRDKVLGNSVNTQARLNFQGTTRCYSSWPGAAMEASLGVNAGRNLFHNSLFNIQQRGAGPFTVGGFTADRWLYATGTAGGSRTINAVALADADRLALGEELATNALQSVFVGGSAAGDFDLVVQRIENARRTAGRLVTVSFYANAAAALNVGINFQQNFGVGGSTSVTGTAQVKAVGTAWARYVATFAVPVATGQTFGTAGTDFLAINLFLSSGATNNTLAGGIGVQSGTLNLWGMQCETSPLATPLERPDPRVDLEQCQRSYLSLPAVLCSGYDSAAGAIFTDLAFPTPMRATPSVSFGTITYSNGSTMVLNAATPTHVRLRFLATATGNAWGQGQVIMSAEL